MKINKIRYGQKESNLLKRKETRKTDTNPTIKPAKTSDGKCTPKNMRENATTAIMATHTIVTYLFLK